MYRKTIRPMSNGEYRVFLALDSGDFAAGLSRTRDLFEKTHEKSQFFAVGPAAALERLRATGDFAASWRLLEVSHGASRSAALALILRDFNDQDFVLVKPGLIAPENWDLRLSWTARRFPGVATVSPLFSSDFADGPGGATSCLNSFDQEALDRLCYRRSQFQLIETGGIQDYCLYVRSEAVRAVAPLPVETEPAKRLRHFSAQLRRLRYSHLVADHVYVAGTPPELRRNSAEAAAAVGLLGRSLLAAAEAGVVEPPVREFLRPRVLHLMHSWGGGLERWVREYCRADCARDNLVLRSSGSWGAFGSRLVLYRHVEDREPEQEWPLLPAIKSTEPQHEGYRAALAKIIDEYGVEAILISSLIGHSLEALRTGLPTALVCHDYYPFCPALNITFSDVCQRCDAGDLAACTAGNPHHRFFRNTPPAQWLELRSEFLKEVAESRPLLAAPSPSVRENYSGLAPELAAQCRVIPHGTRRMPGAPLRLDHLSDGDKDSRLRLLVLGSLAPNKGRSVLESIWKELLQFADIFLVGCGDFAQDFAPLPAVTVIPEYRWDTLAEILCEIEPDIALLPAVVPETFSFTLQELFELAIPTLASDLGSFHDRIEDGVTGFLCAPEPAQIVARLRSLAVDRETLARVHQRLRATSVRGLDEMLSDYRQILPTPTLSAKAYFSPDSRPPRQPIALGCCELRWDSGAARSAPFRPASAKQAIELRWSEQAGRFTHLELDPIGGPGIVRLFSARLFEANGALVWLWDGSSATFAPVATGGTSGPSSATLMLTPSEAAVRLPISLEQVKKLREGGRFEIEMEWLPAGSAGRPAHGSPAPVLTPDPKLIELRPAASREQLSLELESARLRIADLEGSLSWRLSRPLRSLGAAYLKALSSFKERE